MSKLLKYSLIAVLVIGIFLVVAYYRGLRMSESEKNEALSRAKSVNFEIVKEETNNSSAMFFIYYPTENPTEQNMKDLAAYIIYEKAQELDYVSVSVCDDRTSAVAMANPSDESLSDEELRERFKSALEHQIIIWDTLDYKIIAGKNYKYLDGLDVRL